MKLSSVTGVMVSLVDADGDCAETTATAESAMPREYTANLVFMCWSVGYFTFSMSGSFHLPVMAASLGP